MGTFLGVLVVLLVLVWIALRLTRGGSTAAAGGSHRGSTQAASLQSSERSPLRADVDIAVLRDYGDATQRGDLRRVAPSSKKEHVPPFPTGQPDTAWSPRTQQTEVAGEWYRAKDLRRLFTKHAKLSDSGAEIRLEAVLVPDPTNPYDRNAVAVFVDGLHVGYMERPDARVYHGPISKLPGGQLAVPSRQWLRATAKDTWARVTLSLPKADHLVCPNPIPGPCILLPPGSTIQVTREEEHMGHLAMLLDRFGSDMVVCASLRSLVEQRPRSSVELVGVDIEGDRVGVLSPAQTANFLPLVQRAESIGRTLTCRASLRGNSLKADVALHARKAHELDDAEITQLFG